MLGAEAGSEFFASSVSFKSIKLAAMGGGGVIGSTSGSDRKKPNPQMISSQTITASGNGHHRRISDDRELAIVCGLFMFHRDQKMLGAGRSGS